ncbi:hypothetical protein E2F46_16035 [Luteimonas aestuarii]|uniref:Uncharacterized protein n=1 Tax=Luteimonas aestuarii TaxID=453837 RepID=A0A4R5TQN7_9GAMM|nr:hypothetical protein [Luteimonas aestuarii]TDK20511.1 hypothetical protein E2F46_16035 [Luteimonas aestuarii]
MKTDVATMLSRRALLAVAGLGFVLFAGLWLLSMARPHLVEQAARTLLVEEVERRVGERLDLLSGHTVVGLARQTMARHAGEAEQLQQLQRMLPARVAGVVDAMSDPQCPCRAELAQRMHDGIGARLQQLARLDERLDGLVRGAYAHTAARLHREFRIFTGANALVFLLLGIVALRKRAVALQLWVPAVVLVAAATAAACLYLFNQDWVRTIVFDDYVGYGYFAWLALLVALFADILANRARVTTRIVNAVLDAIGSAVTAVPC